MFLKGVICVSGVLQWLGFRLLKNLCIWKVLIIVLLVFSVVIKFVVLFGLFRKMDGIVMFSFFLLFVVILLVGLLLLVLMMIIVMVFVC